MRPDFNRFTDDDLPKPANQTPVNNEELPRVVNRPTPVEEPVITPSPFVNIEPTPTPEIAVKPKGEDIENATIGSLLNTMNLEKSIIKNFDQPLEKPVKKPSKLLIIGLIIVALAAIVFSIIQLFNPIKIKTEPKNNDQQSSIDQISKRTPSENDELTYADKLILEVPNKILFFSTTSLSAEGLYPKENVYLYINAGQELMATIGNDRTVIDETTIGYKVSNLTNKIANILIVNETCDINTSNIFIITTDGYLFMINLGKLLESGKLDDIYNTLTNATVGTTIEIEMLGAVSSSGIKSFTTITDSKETCSIYYPYVLNNNNEIHALKYNQTTNVLTVWERYYGHVNILNHSKSKDFYVYSDKTIGNAQGNLIADVNGQNFKIEKILVAKEQELITDLKSPYVFISTDNKLITFDSNESLKVSASNNTVVNLTPSDPALGPVSYTIEFNDATNKVFSAPGGIDLIDVQSLIDNPIN